MTVAGSVRSGPNGMYLRHRGHMRRRIDRRRCLSRLSDRQLIRRYERYLRQEEVAAVWMDEQPGLTNAIGCRNNLTRWRESAEQELRGRGLHPPLWWEAWLRVPEGERFNGNHHLPEVAGNMDADDLTEAMAEAEKMMPCRMQWQRVRILEARAAQLEAMAEPAGGAALSEKEAISLSLHLAQALERRVGYRLRTSELRRALLEAATS